MADAIETALHAAGQAARFGWYFGLNRLMDWQSRRSGKHQRYAATRPVPTTRELLADLAQLFMRDAQAVREGIYPPHEDDESLAQMLRRAQAMLADLSGTLDRRAERDASTARNEASAAALPDYYAQDFHFQTGGYLTDNSARLYDTQVETLFLGGAGAMRREALRPIAEFMRGRDQRQTRLVDVACGTGRLLREIRLAWPAMQLTGVDLSRAYLDEARRHLAGLRKVELIEAQAERMPLDAGCASIVTSVFLFHELPPQVRRAVAAEMARVLQPGGLLVFIDSLQMGDRPAWDGLLETFPQRFHEPYFRHYATDDLDRLFADAGLAVCSSWTSYLSKVVVCRKL